MTPAGLVASASSMSAFSDLPVLSLAEDGPFSRRKLPVVQQSDQQLRARTVKDALDHVAEQMAGDFLVASCRYIAKRPLLVRWFEKTFFV